MGRRRPRMTGPTVRFPSAATFFLSALTQPPVDKSFALNMRRLLPLFSLLLLAVWLPATQHCVLDAAGVVSKACSDDSSAGEAHAKDACTTVEGTAYKASTGTLKISAPDLTAVLAYLGLQLAPAAAPLPSVMVPAGALDRPRDWVSTWQFVQRAAPSPRAPSLTLA